MAGCLGGCTLYPHSHPRQPQSLFHKQEQDKLTWRRIGLAESEPTSRFATCNLDLRISDELHMFSDGRHAAWGKDSAGKGPECTHTHTHSCCEGKRRHTPHLRSGGLGITCGWHRGDVDAADGQQRCSIVALGASIRPNHRCPGHQQIFFSSEGSEEVLLKAHVSSYFHANYNIKW